MINTYFKFIVMLLLISTMIFSCSYTNNNSENIDGYGYESFKLAILNSVGRERPPNDVSGLIVFLGGLDDDSARKLLVELTDYYLGSATGEALNYSIVRQGKKILPNLERHFSGPIICSPAKTNRSVSHCLSLEERNHLIRHLITIINSNKELDYIM